MFEKLQSFLYRAAFMILFFVLAKSCVSDYVNGGDKDKIRELEQMINDKTTVLANLSNEYTETTIAKVVKLYKFDYSFVLNSQSYAGKITLNETPNTNQLNVYYLSNNPSIISADPYADLKSEKEKGNSISDLLVGIVWGILAVILLISIMYGFTKREKPKIAENKSVIKNKKNATEALEDVSEEEKLRQKIEKEKLRKQKEDPTRFMPK